MKISFNAETRDGTVKAKTARRRNGIRFGASRGDSPSRTGQGAPKAPRNGEDLDVQEGSAALGKAELSPATNGHSEESSLTEIIKALLKVAREHGQLTYDDINDILPEGVSAEELDAIHTRLHELGIEITEH